MLDNLAERDLVVRERPADNRRTVRVSITSAGVALLRSISAPLRVCHTQQLGHLSARDLRKLASLLHAAREPHEREDSAWR
jgi:DNA-binding MarR family transcriptional regulator